MTQLQIDTRKLEQLGSILMSFRGRDYLSLAFELRGRYTKPYHYDARLRSLRNLADYVNVVPLLSEKADLSLILANRIIKLIDNL
jgi:hypothetical protein